LQEKLTATSSIHGIDLETPQAVKENTKYPVHRRITSNVRYSSSKSQIKKERGAKNTGQEKRNIISKKDRQELQSITQ
jgi:hypothetical protein